MKVSSDSSGVHAPLLADGEEEFEERVVQPFLEPDPQIYYPPNVIVTSRYNVISFLPKSIFEQFRRLANVYFLVLGIIAAIGSSTNYYDTAVQPAGLLIPMTIVVMISIIKDGIEDVKRHHADNRTNNRLTRVIRPDGSVEHTEWKNLIVGSMLLLLGDDEVPADCVVLECGGIQGPTTYVETAAIDGETNLKIRLPAIPRDGQDSGRGARNNKISVSTDKTQVLGLQNYRTIFHVELPNGSIHRFNGSMELYDLTGADGRSEHTLTEKNLCLRGSVIRASEWAVCMVVYTGKDTKLSLNSKSPPSKLSVVDSVVNRTLIIAISAMLIVCVFSSIASIVWEINNDEASYLCLHEDDQQDRYSGGGCESGSTNSALTILTFATLFNNFVCISMYVSLEMVYLWQAYFISQDLTMYDAKSDSPAEAHTSGMCADLGQVQYILSDKTGTLTKNVMKLRRCSVGGMLYGAPLTNKLNPEPVKLGESSSGGVTGSGANDMLSPAQHSTSSFDSFADGGNVWTPLSALSRFRTLPPGNDQSLLLNFMRVLSVCNNVMLMPDQKTGKLDVTDKESLEKCLEAESADEVALVLASAEHAGVVLIKRDSDQAGVVGLKDDLTIDQLLQASSSSDDNDPNTPNAAPITGGSGDESVTSDGRGANPGAETFQVLAINEFDSHRKRMSIVVRVEGGPPVLLCKGADSAMFPCCVNGPYTSQCKEHVDEFACTGLRTLVMAKRNVGEEEYRDWLERYRVASNSLVNRKEMLRRCAEDIETDMQLLGACGIEDELQDGVFECINTLNKAGLNLWMITGDKAETAVAIGRMCGLLRLEHELELLLKLTGSGLRQKLEDLVLYLERLQENERKRRENATSGASGAQDHHQRSGRSSPSTVSTTLSGSVKRAMDFIHKSDNESQASDSSGYGSSGKHEARGARASDMSQPPLDPQLSEQGARSTLTKPSSTSLASAGPAHTKEIASTSFSAHIQGATPIYNRYRASLDSGDDNGVEGLIQNPVLPRDRRDFSSGLDPTSGPEGSGGCESAGDQTGSPFNRIALIVDGVTLEEIWRDKTMLHLFVKAARMIPTVVACRVSPLQKASLVRMIKTGEGSPVTLAIGDGANDIGMIHEAKIGVGICGNEGRHAANSADFAIGQFRFLTPLLLKHGRYNYIRSCKLVLYSFFKNLVLVSTLFYYALYSGFSGTMPLESIVFSGFNFYLGLPIIAIGMMDLDIPYSATLRFPRLAYATGRNRELLNLWSMGRWCALAFVEGLVLFAMVVRFVGGKTTASVEDGRNIQGVGINNEDGKAGGIYVEGFLMFCCVILAMQYKVAAITCTWTWIHAGCWVLSLAGFLMFASVYSQFEAVYDWYKVVNFTLHQGTYWLALLLIPMTISILDFTVEQIAAITYPTSQDRLKDILASESNEDANMIVSLLSRCSHDSTVSQGVKMSDTDSTAYKDAPGGLIQPIY